MQMLPSFPAANKENAVSLPVRPTYCSPTAREKNLWEMGGMKMMEAEQKVFTWAVSSAAHVHAHTPCQVHVRVWSLTDEPWQNVDLYQ